MKKKSGKRRRKKKSAKMRVMKKSGKRMMKKSEKMRLTNRQSPLHRHLSLSKKINGIAGQIPRQQHAHKDHKIGLRLKDLV